MLEPSGFCLSSAVIVHSIHFIGQVLHCDICTVYRVAIEVNTSVDQCPFDVFAY